MEEKNKIACVCVFLCVYLCVCVSLCVCFSVRSFPQSLVQPSSSAPSTNTSTAQSSSSSLSSWDETSIRYAQVSLFNVSSFIMQMRLILYSSPYPAHLSINWLGEIFHQCWRFNTMFGEVHDIQGQFTASMISWISTIPTDDLNYMILSEWSGLICWSGVGCSAFF